MPPRQVAVLILRTLGLHAREVAGMPGGTLEFGPTAPSNEARASLRAEAARRRPPAAAGAGSPPRGTSIVPTLATPGESADLDALVWHLLDQDESFIAMPPEFPLVEGRELVGPLTDASCPGGAARRLTSSRPS